HGEPPFVFFRMHWDHEPGRISWGAAVVQDPAAALWMFPAWCGWCCAHSRAPMSRFMESIIQMSASPGSPSSSFSGDCSIQSLRGRRRLEACRGLITRRRDEPGQFLAILQIPDAHLAVVAATGQAFRFRVDRKSIDPIAMTGEGANQFLFLERVLPDFFVGAATEFGFVRNAQLEDVVVEPANLTGILALLRVPETDFFVAARRADLIVGEGHGKHGALMAGVTGLQFAALRVINTGRAIPACRREAR